MSGDGRKKLVVDCLLCSRRSCILEENDDDIVVRENQFLFEILGDDADGETYVFGRSESEPSYPGGSRKRELKKQEAKVFVLRKILDIPQKWCDHKQLSCNDETIKTRGNSKRNALIQICDDCLSTGVLKAWHICQQIMELEKSFVEIKVAIRESMQERAERKRKKMKDGRRSNVVEVMHEEVAKLTFEQPTKWEAPPITPDLSDHQASVTQEDSQDMGNLSVSGEIEDDIDDVVEQDQNDFDDMFKQDQNDNDNFDDNDNNMDPDWKAVFTVNNRQSGRKKRKARVFHYCTRCTSRTRFATEEALSDHMELHAENDTLGDAAFNCVHCSFPCKNSVDLDIHVHNRHVIPSRLKTYSCTLCPFQTKIWRDLKRHVEAKHPTATEEELGPKYSLRCTKCDKKFPSPQAFNNHERRVHPIHLTFGEDVPIGETTVEPVQCTECGVLFETPDKLQFHIFSAHKRECRYVCEQCGKGFPHKKHLVNHKITHEPHVRQFVCHLCGADYSHQWSLLSHYRKHHPSESSTSDMKPSTSTTNNEQIYKCRHCDLTSPFSVVIHRHLLTHKKEMGHECDKCGKFYMNVQGLKRHQIINHPDNAERKFRCPYCYKAYTSQNSVEGHVKKHCRIKRLKERQKLCHIKQDSIRNQLENNYSETPVL